MNLNKNYKNIEIFYDDTRNDGNTVLIESCPKSYFLNFSNSIPCHRYKGDPHDDTLLYLQDYLHDLVTGSQMEDKCSPHSVPIPHKLK